MPVPHLEIRIVQRSKGSSAVAGAAYQAGENLFSEYDQKSKDHRRKQHEVVYTEIMLPSHAPPEYADRATLWNSAKGSGKLCFNNCGKKRRRQKQKTADLQIYHFQIRTDKGAEYL